MATMINAKELETGIEYNNFDKWYNTVHMFEAGYFVDPDENAVSICNWYKSCCKDHKQHSQLQQQKRYR